MEIKTYLLENDDYYWDGQEDFCVSIDPNWKRIMTDGNNFNFTDMLMLTAYLSQPSVENLIIVSTLESKVYMRKVSDLDYQLALFLPVINTLLKIKEKQGRTLNIHLEYTNKGFLKELKSEHWGWNVTAGIKTMLHHYPNTLFLNLYEDYKHIGRLVYEDFNS